MNRRILPLLLLPALLGLSLPALAAGPYFHLDIQSADGNSARHEGQGRVSIDVPVSLVQAIAALIPDGIHSGGKIVIDEHEIPPAQLRRIWREVRNLPEAKIATFEDHEGRLTVSKQAGHLVFRATDPHDARGGEAVVRIPSPVVDALLSGDPGELDFSAAIDALARSGRGELVAVTQDRDTVRIWVDDREGR
ncbi:MAG TPA: hypothetical protein VGS22_14950 [Thermoanaerobaculia bacterium]|nr:hypothetical protein [Thermoanaerobaculia bacterium]